MTKLFLLLLLQFLMILNLLAQDQPNIILIYVDDLNFSGNAIGGQEVNTPNLQRLVDEGVSFENAHANGPVCSPSRASMLTGVYPHTSGYYGFAMGSNSWHLNPVLSSISDMFAHFKNNGYEVFGIGKLLHGDHQIYQESFTIYDPGDGNGPWAWDGISFHNGQPLLMTHPSMPENFSSHTDGIAPLSDVPTIGGYTGWLKNRSGTPFHYVSEDDRDLLEDELARDFGVNIINSQSADEPFLLAIGISKPHSPFYLPKQYFDMHPINQITLPNILEDDLDDVPIAVMNNRWNSSGNWKSYRDLLEASADSTDQQWWLKRYVQGYYAGVSYVDDLLGDILDALENSLHADNTYVIYTSDHGYHLGEKTMIKKTTLYDVVTKVPFVISGPGIEGGATTQVPVSCIDLFPTMIDWADIPLPQHNLDGHILRPLLEAPQVGEWEGPPVALCSAASSETIPHGSMAKALHQHHTVKSLNMRYSLYATGEEEFYDHAIDPSEYFNLAMDAAYQDDLEWHRNELLNLVGIADEFVMHDTANYAFHGSFEQELNGWLYFPNNNSVAAVIMSNGEQTDGEAYLQISSENGVNVLNNNIRLETGQTYIAHFDARCSESTDIQLQIQRDGLPNFSVLHLDNFSISNLWQTYSTTFQFNDTIHIFNNRIRLTLPPQTSCDFDRIRILKSGPVDVENALFRNYPVRIFPNPNNQGVALQCEIDMGTFGGNQITVRIFSPNGKLVKEETFSPMSTQEEINVKGLSKGIYFVQFSANSAFSTQKLVIN